MPTEANELPKRGLQGQSSSIISSKNSWVDEDISSRIRSLLLSRNYNFPPRTPFSSDERLNNYSDSHVAKLLTETWPSNFSNSTISDTHRNSSNCKLCSNRKPFAVIFDSGKYSVQDFECCKKSALKQVKHELKSSPDLFLDNSCGALENPELSIRKSLYGLLEFQSDNPNTSLNSKSEPTNTFPGAIQSSIMVSGKTQDPSYSTSVTTNFSLAGPKYQTKSSTVNSSKPYRRSPNQSVYSDISNDETRRGKPEVHLKPRPKSPSLLSATSKKSARHGLLKPSIKDNRPADIGLPIPPIITQISSFHDNNQIGLTRAGITRISIEETSHNIQPGMEKVIMSKNSTSLVTEPPIESVAPRPSVKKNHLTSDQYQRLSEDNPKAVKSPTIRNTELQPSIKLLEINHRELDSSYKPSIHRLGPDESNNLQTSFSQVNRAKTSVNYESNAIPSPNLSTENSDVHFRGASYWDPITQSLRSKPQSISENVPSKYKASWWEGSPRRRFTTGDQILLPRNHVPGTSNDEENEIFRYNYDDSMNYLRPKNVNAIQNPEIYSDEEPIHPKVNQPVFVPYYGQLPSELNKQDSKSNRNKAVPNGYTAVPTQDLYSTHTLSNISANQNSLNINHSRFKKSREKISNQNKREIHSVSSVESFKTVDSANKDHNPDNPQSFGLHETENAESSLKNTVAWLKNIIPSNSPLENSLASLTRRARQGQSFRNSVRLNTVPVQITNKSPSGNSIIPLESRESTKQKESFKSRHDHSISTDVSETLADTINDLEILMKEAIILAQQAGQCHDSAHVLSVSDNYAEIPQNGQINASQFTGKASSIDGAHQNLQSPLGKSATYQNEESLNVNPASRNVVSYGAVKNNVSRPKSEPERRLTGLTPTINPSVPLRLSKEDSQKLEIEYPQSHLMQSREAPSASGIVESSNKPGVDISENDNIFHQKNSESSFQQPFRYRNTYLKRKCSSVSPRRSRSSRSRKAFIENGTANKLSDLQMESFSQVSLGISKPGPSYTQGNLIDRPNYNDSVAQILKRNNSFVDYSGADSATTCSEVVNFSAGFGMNHQILSVTNESKSPGGNQISEKKEVNLTRPHKMGHKKQFSLSGKSHISLKDHHFNEFNLAKSHKRQTIARDWSTGRKRFVATVSCISTSLIGILVGIYSGETPAIQYYIADFHHYTVLGNVFFFISLAIPTFFAWPLPLLHGRKPYILGSMSIAMPLLFPQALAVGDFRSPYESIWRVGLILPRTIMGFCLGFANMNFKSMLTDLFGASLQSSNPHQEHADEFDVRRHGGGMGIWLGLWTWSTLGSIGLGFFIGATIVETLPPSWGFYISIIIISFVMLLNVVCPEVRRSTYRRSMAEVVTKGTISRRLARGEVKMHMVKSGPKWWGEELHYGIKLSQKMVRQPGFLIMSLYVAWIYGQQVLITLLLGALMSKDYNLRSRFVGLSVMAIAFGALIAIPFQKASLFSRTRRGPPVDDDGTLSKKKLHWSSHMLRRTIFVLFLPIFGLLITLTAGGPPVPFILPLLVAGIIGFLSSLAMAECLGIIMETFDTSDLEPGMIGHPRGLLDNKKGVKRTNYSSYPRVCSAFAITETFGYIFAAGASGIGGVLTRHLGQQAAIGTMTGVLFILSLLLLGILVRYTEIQIIPDSKVDEMNRYQARRASQSHLATSQADDDESWRPIIIGNPHQSTRRMCLLELGSLSRFSEIRTRNKLIDEMSVEARHPNINAMNFLERKIKEKEVEIIDSLRKSFSRSSRSSQKNENPAKRHASEYRGIPNAEIGSRGDQKSVTHKRIISRSSKILE